MLILFPTSALEFLRTRPLAGVNKGKLNLSPQSMPVKITSVTVSTPTDVT